MRLIVGLGNPGEKYAKTRHNVGFMVLDKIAHKLSLLPFRLEPRFNAKITETGGLGENRVIFAKPQGYMNNSGESVSKIIHYYKIGTDDLVEIKDDLDLSLGAMRIKTQTSSGGHKGSESISQMLQTEDRFVIKIGIGSNREKNLPAEEYVLQRFTLEEKQVIDKTIDLAANRLIEYINEGSLKE